MEATLQSLGIFPGKHLELLAAGNWPNTSGHEDYAQLKPARQAEAREYHQSFVLALSYLAANPTSRIHSTQLRADVQEANPNTAFAVSETACLSAALSTMGGFVGVPGTVKAYVCDETGEGWQDVEGIWLSR